MKSAIGSVGPDGAFFFSVTLSEAKRTWGPPLEAGALCMWLLYRKPSKINA